MATAGRIIVLTISSGRPFRLACHLRLIRSKLFRLTVLYVQVCVRFVAIVPARLSTSARCCRPANCVISSEIMTISATPSHNDTQTLSGRRTGNLPGPRRFCRSLSLWSHSPARKANRRDDRTMGSAADCPNTNY